MKSIDDIMKITNAMYLISSSKVKKARKNLSLTEPYFDKSLDTIVSILDRAHDEKFETFDKRALIEPENRKKAFIVITADKGLCGSYNHNMIKIAEDKLENSEDCTFLVIGQIGRMYFKRKSKDNPKIHFDDEFLYTSQEPNLYCAREIAELITDRFLDGTYDEVSIIYTKMTSSINMEPKIMPLLPLKRENFQKDELNSNTQVYASFMPSVHDVMDRLVPIFLKGVIYSIMVEAFCAEQQARMSAMDNATTSAKDMLADLSLMYNRARQASITQEITEVVAGAQS
jgi:F-type H+-transporting ATPase subunit gamma